MIVKEFPGIRLERDNFSVEDVIPDEAFPIGSDEEKDLIRRLGVPCEESGRFLGGDTDFYVEVIGSEGGELDGELYLQGLINLVEKGLAYGVAFEKFSDSGGVVLGDMKSLIPYLGGPEEVVFVPSEEYTQTVWRFSYNLEDLSNAINIEYDRQAGARQSP